MSLEDAVAEAVALANTETGSTEGLVVGEFVLIAATNGWDDDGDPISQVVVIPFGGGESRILGLIDHAHTTMRAEILGYDD